MRRALFVAAAVLFAGCFTRLGLGDGRLYECNRDAGFGDAGLADGGLGDEPQCPGGFHCGLEGYCHRRDGGVPWRCEADFDCDLFWRCGLRGPDGVGTCQDTRDAGPYRCSLAEPDDAHCELGWRCGPEGTCADPREDALEPTVAYPFDAGRLSPQLDGQERFVVGQWNSGALLAPGGQSYAVAGWRSERAAVALLTHGEAPPLSPRVVAMPLDGGGAVTLLRSLSTDAGAAEAIFTAEGGDVIRLGFTGAGGSVAALPASRSPGVLAARIERLVPSEAAPAMVVAVAGRELAARFAGEDGDAGRLQARADVRDAVATPKNGHLLVATAAGLDVALRAAGAGLASLDGGAWASLDVFLDGGTCSSRAFLPYRLRTQARGGKAVSVFALSGAAGGDACLLGFPVDDDATSVTLAAGFAGAQACAACDADDVAVDVLAPDVGGRSLVACNPRDGGAGYLVEHDVTGLVAPTCRSRVLPGFSGNRPESIGEPFMDARLDGHGRLLGWGGLAPVLTERPFVLPTRPLVLQEGAALVAWSEVTALAEPSWLLLPQVGFARHTMSTNRRLTAPVTGEPRLFISVPQAGQRAPTIAVARGPNPEDVVAAVPATEELLPGPFHAVARAEPRGATVYASVFDTLFSTFLDDQALTGDAGAPLPLEARVVPSARTAIASVVALPAAPDGGLVHEGYLVANARVFRFEARTPRVWRTEELNLLDKEGLAVWADGRRARVGTPTGEVLGLPSRLPISRRLPGGATATAYAQACGMTFALADEGLYRLTLRLDGGVLGEWVEEPSVAAAFPAVGGDRALSGGMLQGGRATLYVASRMGGVVRLDFEGCP